MGGTKESSVLNVLPYMKHGHGGGQRRVSPGRDIACARRGRRLPCALRWVIANAEEHGFDTEKIVVTGHSAGGHLSLTTGILNESAGFRL